MESPAINEIDDTLAENDPDIDFNSYFGSESGDTEDERIIKEIQKNIKRSRDHFNDWFNKARVNFDYFAGNQWDEEDLQKLRDERRPALVFNRVPRVINAIAGLELENRQEVIFSPREKGDAIASEILTGAAEWVRENCDAEDEESQMFKDCLQIGMGWTETRLDYETDPDGEIIIERIDPLEMVWDEKAKKRNLDDAAWIARQKNYTKKEFHAIWPEADVDMLNGADHNKGLQPHDATLAPWYINDQSQKDQRENDKVTVTQYQKWIRVIFYRVQDTDNDIVEMDVKEFKKAKKMIDMMGFKYIRQTRRVFKQYFVAGEQMLEKGNNPINKFTFRCITGLQDRNHNYWFGLIQIMRDPQMWSNKWLSQTLDIFNRNSKGGYLAEANAFKDARQAEKSISQANITYVNEGVLAENRIRPKETPAFPTAIDGLLQLAMTSVSDLVGVSLESLGMAKTEQAAVLEVERKRTTITIVADFFDSLRRYRKEQGRVLADFIISYISDGRLVRISGPGLGQYVPLVKAEMDFAYDIIVDETPTSPNQKHKVFTTIINLLPQLLQAGIPIPPEILEYAPLPGSLIRDWQKLINTPPPPDEAEKLKEQIRFQLAELEKGKIEADIQNKTANTLKTKTDAAYNIAKMEREALMTEQDASNMQHEQLHKNLNFGLKLVEGI